MGDNSNLGNLSAGWQFLILALIIIAVTITVTSVVKYHRNHRDF